MQDNARHYKAIQDNTIQDNTIQNKTRHDNIKQATQIQDTTI